MNAPSTFAASAMVLAAEGLAVFPIRAGSKIPLVPWAHGDPEDPDVWRRPATTDPATVLGWWSERPTASVGVATGPSRLVVVDADGHRAVRWYREQIDSHGAAPTRAVVTGSGGFHWWYTARDGPRVRNSAGKLAPGIDIRADGGMVVAPPSWHACGKRYEWIGGRPHPITPCPAWLAELLIEVPDTMPLRRPVDAPASETLAGLVRVVANAPEGERNSRLHWAGRKLRDHVRAGRLDLHAGVAALLDAAAQVGLGDREAIATLRSALRQRVSA